MLDLMNQKPWVWGPTACVLTSPHVLLMQLKFEGPPLAPHVVGAIISCENNSRYKGVEKRVILFEEQQRDQRWLPQSE